MGIIYDPSHYHAYWMAACLDIQVSYRVIDIRTDDWIDRVTQSGCSAFLIWPMLSSAVLKEMVDER